MTRLILALVICALAALSGCKAKPSETACREAILNIRKIRGLDTADVGADPRAAVRSCRAQSSKKTVSCYREAKTEADLDVCRGDGGGLEDEDKAAAKPAEDTEAAADTEGTEAAADTEDTEAAADTEDTGAAADTEATDGEAANGEAAAADGEAAADTEDTGAAAEGAKPTP